MLLTESPAVELKVPATPVKLEVTACGVETEVQNPAAEYEKLPDPGCVMVTVPVLLLAWVQLPLWTTAR